MTRDFAAQCSSFTYTRSSLTLEPKVKSYPDVVYHNVSSMHWLSYTETDILNLLFSRYIDRTQNIHPIYSPL